MRNPQFHYNFNISLPHIRNEKLFHNNKYFYSMLNKNLRLFPTHRII